MKLGNAISQIGNENNESGPTIIGLAEVENKKALKDLVNTKTLVQENYNYIHYDLWTSEVLTLHCYTNPKILKY